MKQAIIDAFHVTDDEYLDMARQRRLDDGSTAVVALIQQHEQRHQMVVGHCGDSRAVVCRDGRAVRMTEDHKPNRRDEERRIKQCGGNVANVAGEMLFLLLLVVVLVVVMR